MARKVNTEEFKKAAINQVILQRQTLSRLHTGAMVSPDDLDDFINCFFADPPCPEADFNNDGFIESGDLDEFITAFFAEPINCRNLFEAADRLCSDPRLPVEHPGGPTLLPGIGVKSKSQSINSLVHSRRPR